MRPPGGHGEGPRRNHGEAAGTKWGSSPVERTAVNVGTVPVLTHHPGGQPEWWVGSTVDRDRYVERYAFTDQPLVRLQDEPLILTGCFAVTFEDVDGVPSY